MVKSFGGRGSRHNKRSIITKGSVGGGEVVGS